MKIAVMQPYFLPYIGYFQLLYCVDQFVVYDDVNYINKGWINRNYILINGQKKMFTISLAKASQNKLIKDIEIADDFKKFKKTISINYARAPFYKQSSNILDNILSYESKNLSEFITNSLKILSSYLGITTKIIASSTINKDNSLKGQEKIIAISEELMATTYINPIGGIDIYNKELFKKHGIQLRFLKSLNTPYKQYDQEFIPNLSILDVLMHNSPSEINKIFGHFELI